MANPDQLRITTRDQDGIAILSPEGEIGYQEAPALRAYVKQAFDKKPKRVVVDLAGVNYMSTPGVATLVEALQISKRTTIPLVLCGMTERVRAIFEIARLQTVFNIKPDLTAALAG